jgi:hypothetical protein
LFRQGAAVLVIQDNATLAHSTFRGDPEVLLWEISPTRTMVVGAILLINTTFNGYTFEGVGFSGPLILQQVAVNLNHNTT